MKPPAFQFYADDFVAGTSILSTEEIGAYILLLCHQWNAGSIPNDDKLILRIAKITQPFDLGLLRSKFELVDGCLKNARLERERLKQQAYREKQAENGAKGGRPKTLAFPKPNPTHNPNESFPSPSPSPRESESAPAPADAHLPTWDEVKTFAEMSAIKPESAKSFYDHHEGHQLWLNQHGKLINWKHKLTTWAAKDRTKPPEPSKTDPFKMTKEQMLAEAIR